MVPVQPIINAVLNALSAVCLLAGYFFIHSGRKAGHRNAMLGALSLSVLFLISYLVYHYSHGSTKYTGEGWLRPVYFTILISHSILAVFVAPLAIRLVYLAFRGNFEAHRKLARWTFPIWMYVSVTGVVITWMLYGA